MCSTGDRLLCIRKSVNVVNRQYSNSLTTDKAKDERRIISVRSFLSPQNSKYKMQIIGEKFGGMKNSLYLCRNNNEIKQWQKIKAVRN